MTPGSKAVTRVATAMAVVLSSCEASDMVALEARAKLTPTAIDFGEVALGTDRSASVLIENLGTAALVIESFAAPAASEIEVQVDHGALAPRSSRTAVVHFAPLEASAQAVDATLLSNAVNGPQRLALQGVGVAPEITVSPDRYDFGTLAPGASARASFVIENRRPVDQPVQIAIADDGAGHFSLYGAPVAGGALVPGNGTLQVEVRYRPQQGGDHAASLRVGFGGAGNGVAVALVGRCQAPHLTADPLAVDFGVVAVGASEAATIALSNRGLAPLQVTAIELRADGGAFALAPLAVPLLLGPGATTALGVQFAPLVTGEFFGCIVISSDDPAQPTGEIELRGTCQGPRLVAVPDAIEFGLVHGVQTLQRTLLLSNRGDVSASVFDLALTGSSDFSLASTPAVPFVLEPGAMTYWSVVYAPLDQGADNGVLQIRSDANAVAVALGGSRRDDACNLVAATTDVRFGHVQLGTERTYDLELFNDGSRACELAGIEFALAFANDPQFALGPGGATSVAVGASRTVTVQFAPVRDGLAKAVLSVRTAEPASVPLLVAISGTGARWSLVAVPPAIDFGSVTIGCPASPQQVAVINDGTEPVAIARMLIDSTSDGGFGLASGQGPTVLQPGRSQLVGLTFTPLVLGAAGGLMVVEGTAGERWLTVPLTAAGIEATRRTDRFAVPPVSKVDVLFVVDNSGSMQDNQDSLAQNFDRFIRYADFRNTAVDYQIAVTTTDVMVDEQAGRFVDPPRIMTRNTPALEQQFASAVRVGTYGSGAEHGLDAMYWALSSPLIDDATANGGFLRVDAALAVIAVSDEEDQSADAIEFFFTFLQGLKARSDRMPATFHAVSCGIDCVCAEDWGAIVTRYETLANLTGGQRMSICTTDWGGNLEILGAAVFLARGRLPLTAPAQPDSIQVFVSGVRLGDGKWSYDAALQMVIVDGDALPDPGAVIEVSYVPAC